MAKAGEVLALFRAILRTGGRWTGSAEVPPVVAGRVGRCCIGLLNSLVPSVQERDYILKEAREVFRRNKDVKDKLTIDTLVQCFLPRLSIPRAQAKH